MNPWKTGQTLAAKLSEHESQTPLAGKVAIVTGASRGIGAAIAKQLAAAGASVIVNYNKSEEKANAVVEEIVAAGGQATAVQADMSSTSQIRSLYSAAIRTYDGVDIVVNNHGIYDGTPDPEVSEAAFDNIIATNVKGVYFSLQEAAKVIRDGGRIINLSTGMTHMSMVAAPNGGLYTLTKGAVNQMTRFYAKHLAPKNVTVNTVAPGAIKTDMGVEAGASDEVMVPIIPLGRRGEPDEVADVVIALCTSCSYVTGAIIPVSGGLLVSA